MGLRICEWDYCRKTILEHQRRCPTHRNMNWWEEYTDHVKRLCWEEEEIPLHEFDDALDIIYDTREAGGPMEAAKRLEEEHGIDPTFLDSRWNNMGILEDDLPEGTASR